MSETVRLFECLNATHAGCLKQTEVLLKTLNNHEQILLELLRKIGGLEVRILELEASPQTRGGRKEMQHSEDFGLNTNCKNEF